MNARPPFCVPSRLISLSEEFTRATMSSSGIHAHTRYFFPSSLELPLILTNDAARLSGADDRAIAVRLEALALDRVCTYWQH